MLLAPRRIELREAPIPDPEPGGIVIRVRVALTDGTDLKTYRRGHPKMPTPTRFGHEFSGDVAAIGPDVERFACGDAVMCVHTAPCGTCYWCLHGQEELCETIMPAMILGAYADFIGVPKRVVDRNCFHKPAGVSYVEGAFLEPLSCVIHSVEMLEARPGSTIAVLGNGAFGILHALLLQRAGAEVLLFGRRAERTAFGNALGISSFDTNARAIVEVIGDRTQGRGADALIECTGSPEIWERAPSFVRRGGRVAFFAGLPSDARVTFSAARLHYDEVGLLAPFHFRPSDVRAAFDLIAAHALPLERLITATYSLDSIVRAFEQLDAGAGLKVVIEP